MNIRNEIYNEFKKKNLHGWHPREYLVFMDELKYEYKVDVSQVQNEISILVQEKKLKIKENSGDKPIYLLSDDLKAELQIK